MEQRHQGLTPDELADHDAVDLPDREAMSLVTPTPVMGGLPPVDTTQPLPPEAGGGTPSDPMTLTKLPALPTENPDGSYASQTSAIDQT